MTQKIVLFLIAVFITVPLSQAAQTRMLRPINPAGDFERIIHSPPRRDPGDTLLQYDDSESLDFFLPLPGDPYGDRYYNVRFTPPLDEFQIMQVYIPLFTFEGMGHPGMRVLIWQSGDEGLPTDSLTSIDIANEDLGFSDAELIVDNIVDFSELEVIFGQGIDFHVGVEAIVDTSGGEYDSLGIYVDNGEDGNQDGRSILWSPEDEAWLTMDELYGASHNFAIRVLISEPDTVIIDVATDLAPAVVPSTILLDPAWPNPFNASANVSYYVLGRKVYTLDLIDIQGRIVRKLAAGVGRGRERVSLNGEDLSAGVYMLRLQSAGEIVGQKIYYLK